ncbi:MAG: lysophospholipid acyltransferase family protein [Anaerolineales bacterium]|jgi:1-acyl-sn-glycerol-3-phosphate acyltransferase
MKRKILYAIATFLFQFFSRLNVSGLENVPHRGPAILAVNHLGIIDAPLIFALVPRTDLTALVAKKHLKNPFLRIIVNIVGGIWINRDEADSHAMRAAREHLNKGGLLGIAPEGTRSPTGGLNTAKTGVAYLADKAKVPIIPIAISGTFKGLKQALLLKRPTINVHIGKPIILAPFERKHRDVALQQYTDEIMCHIAAMLPPSQRGAYAQHPRTIEILEKQTTIDV